MAQAADMENPKMAISRQRFDRYGHNVWHDGAYLPSEPDKQLKFWTFKNPRLLTNYILKNRNVVLMDIINSLLKTGNKTANINVETAVYKHC